MCESKNIMDESGQTFDSMNQCLIFQSIDTSLNIKRIVLSIVHSIIHPSSYLARESEDFLQYIKPKTIFMLQ
jgi:hypothetical protein